MVRMKQADRTAPEELRDRGAPEDDGPRKKREDFHDGVWFSINVGRNERAEPRWLLPMLFKNGDLERGEVGAIKRPIAAARVLSVPSAHMMISRNVIIQNRAPSRAMTARRKMMGDTAPTPVISTRRAIRTRS